MSDKFVAGVVTAAFIAPLCALCLAGPVIFASVFAGAAGWFGGLNPIVTTGLAAAAGFAVYRIVRRRKGRRPPMTLRGEVADE